MENKKISEQTDRYKAALYQSKTHCLSGIGKRYLLCINIVTSDFKVKTIEKYSLENRFPNIIFPAKTLRPSPEANVNTCLGCVGLDRFSSADNFPRSIEI